MSQHLRVVVLAALDGGPFDPYLRAADGAAEIWRTLQRAGIPVVFFSGRTRAELEAIGQELGVRYPFVAEECGAFYAPHRYFGSAIRGSTDIDGYEAVRFGKPYEEVVSILRRTAQQIGVDVVCFGDMSVSEVAEECELTLHQARLAKLRDHSELARVVGDDCAASTRFARALRRARLRCLEGERFMRVSAPVDPGLVADLVIGLFRESFPGVQVLGMANPILHAALLDRVDLWLGDSSTLGRNNRSEPLGEMSDSMDPQTDELLNLGQIVQRIASSGRPSAD